MAFLTSHKAILWTETYGNHRAFNLNRQHCFLIEIFFKGGVSNGGRGENFAGQNRGVAIKNYSVIVVGVSLSVVMGIGLICFVMLRKGGPLW